MKLLKPLVAVAYYSFGAPTTIASPDRSDLPKRISPLRGSFLSFGVGAMEPAFSTDYGITISFSGGQELCERLHLTEGMLFRFGRPQSSEMVTVNDDIVISVGLQWTPLNPQIKQERYIFWVDPRSLIIQLNAGMVAHSVVEYGTDTLSETSSYGPSFGVDLAWMPLQGIDYALGVALHTRVSHYDRSNTPHSSILLTLRLRIPRRT